MSENIIIMAKRDDPFARVSKSMLDDSRLSWRAKGVLSYLLGKPAGWKMRVLDLCARSDDGKHSVRRALDELRACGYAEYVQNREKGRFKDGVWKISDSPIFSPHTKKRDAVKPDAEDRHHSKKEVKKTDLTETETFLRKIDNCAAVETTGEDPDGVIANEVSMPSKPPRSKKEKLAAIPIPKGHPTEEAFDDFLHHEELNCVIRMRPDLFESLCRNRWHCWRKDLQKWTPITDWQKYVAGLEEHLHAVTHRR